MSEPAQFITEEQRAEMFREFHSEHLRRQTKAIETIRGILAVWMTLTVISLFFFIMAASGV